MWTVHGCLGKFLDPLHLAYLLFGVAEGIFVGLLPGMAAWPRCHSPAVHLRSESPHRYGCHGRAGGGAHLRHNHCGPDRRPSSSASATTVLDGTRCDAGQAPGR